MMDDNRLRAKIIAIKDIVAPAKGNGGLMEQVQEGVEACNQVTVGLVVTALLMAAPDKESFSEMLRDCSDAMSKDLQNAWTRAVSQYDLLKADIERQLGALDSVTTKYPS